MISTQEVEEGRERERSESKQQFCPFEEKEDVDSH